jgi:hypothetical protein
MVTIKNTQFSSNQSLVAILNVMTKVKMLDICKKLDLYVSPNLKKEETARRVAQEILANPCDVLHVLNKQELQIVDEFVKAGPNQYVIRKMRKMPYKLQKFGLVLTYEDMEKEQWHMLMPDSVREAFAPKYQPYLDIAEKGAKLPSKKQLRLMEALGRFMNSD